MCLSTIESILKIAAIIAAALFFGWKLFAGWLLINLEVSIELERQAINNINDWLAINLILKKGPTDGLWLKDVAVRLRSVNGDQVNNVIRFNEFESLAIKEMKIDWHVPVEEERKYSMAPEDTFRFGCIETVPSGLPLIIEAAVYGRRIFWKKGFQWRSSVTSLPIGKKEKQHQEETRM